MQVPLSSSDRRLIDSLKRGHEIRAEIMPTSIRFAFESIAVKRERWVKQV